MTVSNQSAQEIYMELRKKFGYPKSERLKRLIEAVFTPEKGELCLALPGTAAEVSEKVNHDVAEVTVLLEEMAANGSIQRDMNAEGVYTYNPVYPPEQFIDSMMHSAGAEWDDELWDFKTEETRRIADLMNEFAENDWYRFERVDELIHRRLLLFGRTEQQIQLSITPAWKALEKCNAEVPEGAEFDLRIMAQNIKERGDTISDCICSCKSRNRRKVPLWTCGSMPTSSIPGFWKHHPKKITREWDPDEWLELMAECEVEHQMVHLALGDVGLYDICTCDTEACNIFYPLKKYAHVYEGLEKGPYYCEVNKDACQGSADCVKRCRFEAISLKRDATTGKRTAQIDKDRCTGCGQCVLGCDVDGALKLELRK